VYFDLLKGLQHFLLVNFDPLKGLQHFLLVIAFLTVSKTDVQPKTPEKE